MTRMLGPMLLLSVVATTVAAAPAPTDNDENTPAYRALMTQKRLSEHIDYDLPIQTTLGKVLNELLDRQDIPYTVNERAFVKAGQEADVVKTTEVGPMDKMTQVSRWVVLNKLLSKIPAKTDDGVAVYVLRPGLVEITTRKAYLDEFLPGRDDAVPPPLIHAIFRKAPLRDALAELADTTGSSVVLDPRLSDEAAAKVTATFTAAPLDAAVEVLADEAGLKLVRLGNVYYVTSRKNADDMRKDEDKRKRENKTAPAAMPKAR